MDQAFACPECGTRVEIAGLAPGRQVRCGFCHRLLEVPFLPRTEVAAWKRVRFGHPGWVPWAWAGLAVVAVVVVLTAAVRILERYDRTSRESSIRQLLSSSEEHEHSGRLDQALIDLDAALDLYVQSPPDEEEVLSKLKGRRSSLVRREALALADRLSQHDSPAFPLGQWLTLRSRVAGDKDLKSLRVEIEGRFQARLKVFVQGELAMAQSAFVAGNPSLADQRCNALEPLIAHVGPPDKDRFHREFMTIVSQVIDRHGMLIDASQGHFLPGPGSRHAASLLTAIRKAVQERGYLPHVEERGESGPWSRAPFRLSVILNERHEGTYLSSENRLTRIDAQLVLTCRGKEIWKSVPTARTMVPIPRVPAYLASRVALGSARIEEFEALLYDNARTKIDEKIDFALSHMPARGDLTEQVGL